MNLTQLLKKQGYDYIDGPVKDFKLFQLWMKKPTQAIELYFDDIHDLLKSDNSIKVIESISQSVNSNLKKQYDLSLGLTKLGNLFKVFSGKNVDLQNHISSAKNLVVSYDQAFMRESPLGDLETFIHNTEISENESNKYLLKRVNKDQVFLISGIIYAKHLKVGIETDATINNEIVNKISAESKEGVSFNKTSNNKIDFSVDSEEPIPIAIKAHRLKFKNNKFQWASLVTDGSNLY